MSARRTVGRLVGALAAIGVLGAAGTGCSLVIDTAPTGPRNGCSGDGDCGSGARCDSALHACVTGPTAPYGYVLQLVLPGDSSTGRPALTTNVGPFVVSTDSGGVGAAVHDHVQIAGTVRSAGRPIDADVVFSPRSEVDGPPLGSITISTTGATTYGIDPIARQNDFATELLSHTTYDVEIRPRGQDAAELAPLRAQVTFEADQRMDVDYDALVHYGAPLIGVVQDASGEPQDGLELRAIERATGRLLSSVATTGADGLDPGAFRLVLDPTLTGADAPAFFLRISAPPAYQESAAFPTIAIDPSVLVAGPDGGLTILVPSPDSGVCFAGTVELPADSSAGEPRPAIGATVTLRGRDIHDATTGIAGSFTVQMVSTAGGDPDGGMVGCSGAPLPAGGFEGLVLPGEYDVEIQPLEPELGVYVGHASITDRTLGHAFAMPVRTVLGGTVQADGEPVPDARVRAIPLHAPLASLTDPMRAAAALLNRPGETVTHETGLFSLPLDVGLYDLVVEAPDGSDYPWVVRAGYGIGGSTAPLSEVFDLRTPVAVHGTAYFDDAEVVAGADVLAFALVAAGPDGATRPVPIGRATTAADGSFLLLLPAGI